MPPPNPFRQSQTPLAGRALAGKVVHLVLARPIVYLDSTWMASEQATILAALQELTDDKLTQTQLSVYSDGSGTGATKKTGETLLRGMQNPTRKVIIAPDTAGAFLPLTSQVSPTGDITVVLPFSSGRIPPLKFFVNTKFIAYGDPSGQPRDVYQLEVTEAPLYVIIGHELIHAFHFLRGTTASGFTDHTFSDPTGIQFTQKVFTEELVTMGLSGAEPLTENNIRLEHHIGVRTSYASASFDLDQQGVKPVNSPAPTWWPTYPANP